MMTWKENDVTWQPYADDNQNGILNINDCVRLIISSENDHRVFDGNVALHRIACYKSSNYLHGF